MYHLIYHEAAHAYSYYTGTLGAALVPSGPPNVVERIAYNEGLANYVASSLSNFTVGHAPTYVRMRQDEGVPEASVGPVNQYRFYPDNLNTSEQCPRNGNCPAHHSGSIWENAYLDLEKRVGKASALGLALLHGIYTNVGANLENSSFVRKLDLYHDECLIWPFILGDITLSHLNGNSPSNSFYAAMQEANDFLFDKKYALEVWDAFDRLLGRQRECLRQPDEFSNYKEAATFIHPSHSTLVDRSPHFREGIHTVPAQINYEGDEDWFYFYAAQEKNFSLGIDPTTSGLMTEISVHRADGSAVLIGGIGQPPSHESMSGIGLTAQVTTAQRGYYYIRLRVHSRSEVKTGSYRLILSPYAFSPPDAESNQMNESATMLSLQGADSAVEGMIHSPSNQDYYRFLTTGWHQPYRVHLQALQQQNLRIVVYVDGNLSSQFSTIGGVVDVNLSFAPGQWIFLEVSSAAMSPNVGTYRLSVEPLQTGSELEEFSQTFENPATSQTITENVDPRSIATPIVLEMETLNNRLANTIVDDLPRYYRFWAERGEDVLIETFGLKQTATTKLFLYEQINKFAPLNINQIDSTRLVSQGLPALRQLGVRQPLNNLMAVPPLPLGPITNEYARLRTGNGSIYRSFGDSLEIGAGRLHFHIPHTGWYVVGVQPETLGERGDYTRSSSF